MDVALETAQRLGLGDPAGVRPASERRTCCWSSARPQSRSRPIVEWSTAAARSAKGRVSSANTPKALITRMSACSLGPKPSSEARVTGPEPRGIVCSQMPYVVPPSAVAHQTTAIVQAMVAVNTATTVHRTSSHDWASRAALVSRCRRESPGRETRYVGWAIGVASSRLRRRRST